MRNRKCLPRDTTSHSSRPERSAVAIAGTRKSVLVSVLPASARWSRVAATKTVSPSGTEAEAARGRAEPGVDQRLRERCVLDRLAVGALDREAAQRAVASREGQRVDGRADHARVVRVRQQAPATLLDVDR